MKKIILPFLILFGAISVLLIDYHFFSDTEKIFNHDALPGSFRSMQYMNLVRTYPGREIPEDGYTRAFEYSQRVLSSHLRYEDEWIPMGPGNIGGRTLDIAINPLNPNTIYAASASGGLWRSYSGGIGENAWERISFGYPALAIAAVEISPADTSILFAGTGECYGNGTYFPSVSFRATRGLNGMGILKSVDNGLTWEKSLDWSYHQSRGIQRIKFNPDNPNAVWAATTEGTYRSYNLGETWELVHDVPMATDIVINPRDTGTVFIACGGMYSEGHGIYRTKNGGSSWEYMDLGSSGGPSTFGGKARIAMAPSVPNLIYASIGLSQSYGAEATWLCASPDNGDNWSVVNTLDYSRFQGWYSHYVAVSPVDENKLYCGGVDFYQSENGGTTLTLDQGQINNWFHPDWLHSDHHDFEFHPYNPDIIYFAHDGGIHRTDDGGENFYSCNWGYQTAQFYPGFTCSQTNPELATGGLQDNFSCIYRGDYYWDRVVGGDGSWSALNQDNNYTIYNSYQYLNILRSDDGGNYYYNISPPNQGNVNFIAPYMLSPVDNQTMYAATSRVYRSTNGGYNWTGTNSSSQFNNNPVIAMGLSATSADVVYVATMPWYTDPQVFKTINGGEEWINITSNLPNLHPTDIHVDVNDHNRVYITLGGFGGSHLYKTENGGLTWQNIGSSLPDIPGWSVITDPELPNNIYYGNEFGIYASVDGGESWALFNKGLGDGVFAMDLKICSENRMLRVATHGNGVYERGLIDTTVEIDDLAAESTLCLENYPNPFKETTTIHYYIPFESEVILTLYDLTGKQISLMVSEIQKEGHYYLVWNGALESGGRIPPGLYIARLHAGRNIKTLKLYIL